MQTQWYGDKRDLVKWATLVHLCQKHELQTVIQLPFLPRRTDRAHKLVFHGGSKEFHPEVWLHFRDLNLIKTLGDRTGLTIRVVEHEFSHKARKSYREKVLA